CKPDNDLACVVERRSSTQQSDTARLDCSLGECALRQKWQQSEWQNGRPSQDHLVRFDYVWASTESGYTSAVWIPRAEVPFGSLDGLFSRCVAPTTLLIQFA